MSVCEVYYVAWRDRGMRGSLLFFFFARGVQQGWGSCGKMCGEVERDVCGWGWNVELFVITGRRRS